MSTTQKTIDIHVAVTDTHNCGLGLFLTTSEADAARVICEEYLRSEAACCAENYDGDKQWQKVADNAKRFIEIIDGGNYLQGYEFAKDCEDEHNGEFRFWGDYDSFHIEQHSVLQP